VIGKARGNDLPLLREIERAADEIFCDLGMDATADGEPAPPRALRAYERDGTAWVSVDDRDRPIAFLVVDVIDQAAHIEQVSVRPESGRQGIGAALIEAAASWAQEQRLDAMTLMTFRDVAWNRPLRAARFPSCR
jgi:GNAT superfamily N-acetyltransferase